MEFTPKFSSGYDDGHTVGSGYDSGGHTVEFRQYEGGHRIFVRLESN